PAPGTPAQPGAVESGLSHGRSPLGPFLLHLGPSVWIHLLVSHLPPRRYPDASLSASPCRDSAPAARRVCSALAGSADTACPLVGVSPYGPRAHIPGSIDSPDHSFGR